MSLYRFFYVQKYTHSAWEERTKCVKSEKRRMNPLFCSCNLVITAWRRCGDCNEIFLSLEKKKWYFGEQLGDKLGEKRQIWKLKNKNLQIWAQFLRLEMKRNYGLYLKMVCFSLQKITFPRRIYFPIPNSCDIYQWRLQIGIFRNFCPTKRGFL